MDVFYFPCVDLTDVKTYIFVVLLKKLTLVFGHLVPHAVASVSYCLTTSKLLVCWSESSYNLYSIYEFIISII